METAQKIFDRISQSTLLGKPHIKLNPDFPLKGYLHCGYCKKQFTGYWSTGRNVKYPYYGCPNKKDKNRFQIRRKKLTTEFQEFLEKIAVPEQVREVFSIILQTFREQRGQIQSDWIKNKEKQINSIEFKMDRIQQVLVNSSSFHLIKKLEKEREEFNQQKLKHQQEITNRKTHSSKSLIGLLTITKKIFTSVKNIWHLSNPEIKKMFVQVFF